MLEVTENLIVKRKYGWQNEIRLDTGEAQILIVVGTTGQIVKKTKSGRAQEFYKAEEVERWDRSDDVEMIMSMNGTAVLEPGDWVEINRMVILAKQKLGRKLYEDVKKK